MQSDQHLCSAMGMIPIFAKSKVSRLWLVSVAEQAGLSPTWLQLPKTGFLMTWLIYSCEINLKKKSRAELLLCIIHHYALDLIFN